MSGKLTANAKAVGMVLSFAFIVLLGSSIYWLTYVKPNLINDSQAQISSVASVHANALAQFMDQSRAQHMPHAPTLFDQAVQKQLEVLLTYAYEKDENPFFKGIFLETDNHYIERNALQPSYQLGDVKCSDCFYQDYPLYSPTQFSLIGVIRFAMPRSRIDADVSAVQQLFLLGLLLVLVCAGVILALMLQLNSAVSRSNRELETKVKTRTQALQLEIEQHTLTQQKLSQARDETQRLERNRIAKTLHDGIGQTLQALKLGLQRLGSQLGEQKKLSQTPADDELTDLVNELVDDTSEAISIVRDVCAEMMPLHLETLSLSDALVNYVERLNRRLANITLCIDTKPEQRGLSLLEKEQLFLIAVELVNNAVKHSEAKNINLSLQVDEIVILVVSDNGVGLPANYRENATGLGLHLVEERSQRIGATIDLSPANPRSENNGGLRATCELEKLNDNI